MPGVLLNPRVLPREIGLAVKEMPFHCETIANKTAVRFKPRFKAHGYSHCPTALLLLFLSLCERSACPLTMVKRDIVTVVIYCYITTDFHYAKHDSRLSACGGVMLQRVGIEKNVNRHFSLNF